MSQNLENLKFTETHEWAKLEADNIVRVGITDFAQSELGDIMYFTLPDVGRVVAANEQLAVVESVKTASELFSPVSGEVIAINETVKDQPELVNDNAFETWLFCIKADNPDQLDRLMDATGYQQMIQL